MQPLASGQLIADVCDEFLTARHDLKSVVGQPALWLAMERQAKWPKPTGYNPMAQRAAWLGQAQLFMILGRHCARAAIDSIVVVPFAQRVGMWSVQWSKLANSGRNHVRHLEVAKNAVVAVASALVGEQAEEEKHIANANALVLKVRLSRTSLAEQALAAGEHGIFMAKVCTRNPSSSKPLATIPTTAINRRC